METSLLPVFYSKGHDVAYKKNTAESPSDSGMGAVISCANLTVFFRAQMGVVSGEN